MKRRRHDRSAIVERQNGFCACGCGTNLDTCELDHILPLYLGGADEPDNIQALTPACHLRKTVDEAAIVAKTRRLRIKNGMQKPRRKMPKRKIGWKGWKRKVNGQAVKTTEPWS